MSYSATDLNNETDLRFWATTHYKPGQKLDPTNPLDKTMVPVWLDANKRVRAEAAAGTLTLTYKDPGVQAALAKAEGNHDQAADAMAEADARAASATGATLPAVLQAVRSLGAEAGSLIEAGNRHLNDIAAMHPATVNPVVAQAAAGFAAGVAVSHPEDKVAKSQAVQAGTKAKAQAPAKSGGGGGVAIAVGIGVIGLLLVTK